MSKETTDASDDLKEPADVISWLTREANRSTAARAVAVPSLQRIVDSIRQNTSSGQSQRMIAFLGGLLDGEQYPFDMSELRGLDGDLASACIAVLDYDRFGQESLCRWGVIEEKELNKWLIDGGYCYRAEQHRISRRLYDAQFGYEGHTEEAGNG